MTAPMQQAISAAAEAIAAWNIQTYGHRTDADHVAQVAITAAYPHLFQGLARENRELRAEVQRLTELLSPKR